MHRTQPTTSLRQQLEQHGNDITCTCTAMGGALHIVGTQRGSVVAFAGSLGFPEGSASASSATAVVSPLRVVYAKAAHAFAVRCIAVSAVSGLVASGSDDSSIIITSADSFCVDADSDACGGADSDNHEGTPPVTSSSSSSEWNAKKGHTRGDASTAAVTTMNQPPRRSSRRLGLCHTLPVTHVAWCQDGVTLLSSSFDGYVTVSDTNECKTLNRICIGFPISNFCFGAPCDESFLFVVGEGVARVDLLDGSRISQPLLGTKGGTLLSSATFLGRGGNNNTTEAKGLKENGENMVSASPGVVFMHWCTGAGLEDTLTAQRCSADGATFSVPAGAGEEGNVLSQAVARYVVTRNNGRELEVLVESTAISDKTIPASWTALTWNLAAERWTLAVGPYRQATSADSFLSQLPGAAGQDYSTSALIAALDRIPPTINNEGDHHHHEKRHTKGFVPQWSLGYASWYCPPVHRQVVKASTARGLLFLSDEAVGFMNNNSLSEQTYAQRKRSRTQQQHVEASLDVSTKEDEEEAAATRARLELQATCSALAQQLKDCLAARGKK